MGRDMEASNTALPGMMASSHSWQFQQSVLLEAIQSSLVLSLMMMCSIGIMSYCFYNLYLHPLCKIPGPKLAAMTSWPDFYHDVVKDGSYLFEIRKMHETYGPTVRITPNEVHINDPDFFSILYSGGKSKVNKDPSTVVGFGQPDATASTVDHDQHRIRRGYLSHHYSKRAVDSLVPLINERIEALCVRFDEVLKTGRPISLDRAFSAMAADVIYTQFFGAHLDYLSDPGLSVPWRDAFIGLSGGFHISRFIPGLIRLLKKLRPSLLKIILGYFQVPLMSSLIKLQEDTRETIQRMLDEENCDNSAAQCVIMEVLRNPNIPPQDRTIERLVDDGITFGFGGTETLGRSLAVGSFYLLNDKAILAKLREELAVATEKSSNENLTLDEMQRLPYLSGVVKESIRLGFGPIARLPRIHTEDSLVYKGHVLPPGCAVSMSTWFLNVHPKTFPDPWKYRPERWVEATQEGFPLTSYLSSFSRGTRACIGQNLAYAELYMTIARVFQNFDMDLDNTTTKDISVEKIYITGYPIFPTGRMNGEAEVKVKIKHKLET